MTLKDIYDYIEPLLADENMASQEASLIIHCADGSVEVLKQSGGGDVRCACPPLDVVDKEVDS